LKVDLWAISDQSIQTVENPPQKQAHLPYSKRIFEDVEPVGRYDDFFGWVLSRISIFQIL
jgi:hypothetical protein